MLNLKNPDLYNNRETSWLQFNTRVLKQALDESLPLLERLKFLAIYGTNLDEFYMIESRGLKSFLLQASSSQAQINLHLCNSFERYGSTSIKNSKWQNTVWLASSKNSNMRG